MATTWNSRLVLPAVALAPLPRRLVPGEALAAGHHRHEVHADEARPLARLLLQRVEIELAVGSCAITAFGMPFSRMQRGQRAGVDAGRGR